MKVIYSILMIVLLSACANTEKASVASLPKTNSPQLQLAKKVQLYPKDTVALTQLASIQLKQYEADQNLYSLNQVIASYEELLKRQPYNHEVVLQFYRLNLFKGMAVHHYDVAHWQQFYQQQPFLKNIDLAPPEYMALLIAPNDSLSNKDRIKILKATLQANPNFVNGYLTLTAMYSEQKKSQMSLFLLETANKYSPQNIDVIAPLNELRVDKIFDQLCEADVSKPLEKAFEDYKLLVKNFPENPYYHMQLSTVLRLMGRVRMSSFSAKKAASLAIEFQGSFAEAQFWSGNNKALTEYFSTKEMTNLNVDDLYLELLFNLTNFNWQQTANLVDEYITRNDLSFYGVLYGAYAYKMLGQDDMAEQVLTKGLRNVVVKPWQQHLLDFANQKTSAKALMAASKNKCNQSEAYFIQGLFELEAGNTDAFEKNMTAIVNLSIYPFYEYASAKNIMKRLNATASKS
jgi:hypothetical protein